MKLAEAAAVHTALQKCCCETRKGCKRQNKRASRLPTAAPHLNLRPRSPTTVSYLSGKRVVMVSWMHAALAASMTCMWRAEGRQSAQQGRASSKE
jgi:hypothetical protein